MEANADTSVRFKLKALNEGIIDYRRAMASGTNRRNPQAFREREHVLSQGYADALFGGVTPQNAEDRGILPMPDVGVPLSYESVKHGYRLARSIEIAEFATGSRASWLPKQPSIVMVPRHGSPVQ